MKRIRSVAPRAAMLVVVTAGGMVAATPRSWAATVSGQPGRVDVDAAAGERNVVRLSHAGSSLIVVDTGAPLSVAGTGCAKVEEHEVRCELPFPPNGTTGAAFVEVDLGDQDDQLVVDSSLEDPGLWPHLSGGDGNDILEAKAAGADLLGGPGDDRLTGTDREVCRGSSCGAPTDFEGDHLSGGPGDDVLEGKGGRDGLVGDEGNDSLDAGTGPDSLDGGAGDDTLIGDVLTAPVPVNYSDPYAGLAEADELRGGAGNDVLRGGTGSDTLSGAAGDDVLEGGADSDKLQPGPGTDRVSGGDGVDRATYDDREDGLTLSLDGVGNDGAAGEHDNLQPDIEAVVGGEGPDRLMGTPRNEYLWGGDGDDILVGAGGNDQLIGAAGDDEIDAVDPAFPPVTLLQPKTGTPGDDYIGCGTGIDVARADSVDEIGDFAMPVGVDRCEHIERVPVAIGVRNRMAQLTFACRCRVVAAIRAGGRVLARGTGRRRVRMRLTRAGRSRLRRHVQAMLTWRIAGEVHREHVRLLRA